jgi:DNA processing protein
MEPTPLPHTSFPPLLSEIPDTPKTLWHVGTVPNWSAYTFLSVVGSRRYTDYGKRCCESLIVGLRGYPVCIVSGLALGIDGIAHNAALTAGLCTIAVPGSGLSEKTLYPATHRSLARDIAENGGLLLSEFPPEHKARPENFPQRNRIMAGMTHAVLVIEAELRSGTLITSRLATEYNRDVLTVPGSIESETSAGPHMLIQKGAMLITKSEDILEALGIEKKDHTETPQLPLLSPQETAVYTHLATPLPRDELISHLHMSISEANILLSAMELKGLIVERVGNVERA